MSKRKEFPAKVKDQAYARAAGKCQICGLPFGAKKVHFDHILPCALGGEPTLANCAAVCEPCHVEKTAKQDVPRIRKADRQRRAHIGAKAAPAKPIQSAGFAKTEKSRAIDRTALPPLPRRALYQNIE